METFAFIKSFILQKEFEEKKQNQCEAKECNLISIFGKQVIIKGFSFVSISKRRQKFQRQLKVYCLN